MGLLGSHFFLMCTFAAIVAIVVSVIDPERHTPKAKALYGLKVFFAFVGIGVGLGLLMRFIPFP